MENLIITYHQFPTHVPITKNKRAENTYQKINGQNIYSGVMNRFQRDIAVSWLHSYLLENGDPDLRKISQFISFPINLELEFHAPLNYSSIRRIKGNIVWYPADNDYQPNWDIDNQWIWNKLFCDTLQYAQIIPNDNISFIRSFKIGFFPVVEMNDRKLIFKLIN